MQQGMAKTALQSVKQRLTTEYGTCLLAPCYQSYQPRLGEISSYPPGYKENGGIFCHNNPWVSIAETVVNNPEEAFAVYRRVCPAYVEEISEVHRTEPYVYSQMVAGQEAATPGEAKNSWLTGTAAWTFVNVSQHLLGVQPTYEGLSVRPCLPAPFARLTVRRRYRGTLYVIEIDNKNPGGKPILTVDDVPVPGSVIPISQKAECRVKVVVV